MNGLAATRRYHGENRGSQFQRRLHRARIPRQRVTISGETQVVDFGEDFSIDCLAFPGPTNYAQPLSLLLVEVCVEGLIGVRDGAARTTSECWIHESPFSRGAAPISPPLRYALQLMLDGSQPVASVGGERKMRPAGDRYRLGAELGRGGVGVVHRAVDVSTGEEIAFKRLLPAVASNAHTRRRFEREYQTLKELQHPCIIRVHDYGVDDVGPYYTMELLEGTDLKQWADADVASLCRYVRDVASSLALLHARRLIHRDVSPRNVRVSEGGRAKLLDFGALTPFGLTSDVVGTPPFVPPEALAGAALDQRADLFALGALIYFALTGHQAIVARGLDELPLAWQQPIVPLSQRRRDVPPELDALVQSLLALDPLARPSSAAEVIDRLNAIAGLEPEPLDVRQAYLHRPRLAGRRQELAKLTSLWTRSKTGRGAAVVVTGVPGSGKSRLLDELALGAQVAGSSVLSIKGDTNRIAYSAVGALCRLALARVPDATLRTAAPHAGVLLHAIPELQTHLADERPAELAEDPQERRAEVQTALLDWWLALADTLGSLTLLIDDFHAVDELSGAALTALALEAPDHPLLVVASTSRRRNDPDGNIRTLLGTSQVIPLTPLDAEQTLEIMRSLFGDVPHLGRVAQWLHEKVGGNPSSLLGAAQELVRRDTVKYAEGAWVLPQQLSPDLIAGGEAGVDLTRLDGLSPTERGLLEIMSVHHGPLTLELCTILSETTEPRVFDTMEHLLAEGWLRETEGGYVAARESLREAIYATLSDQRRRALHARVGARLAADTASPIRQLDAGWHLLRSGDKTLGAELLASAGRRLFDARSSMAEAAAALDAALAVMREQGTPLSEQLRLMIPLSAAGYLVDRRYADLYGDETFEYLVRSVGLSAAASAGGVLGGRGGLAFGTIWALTKSSLKRVPAKATLEKAYMHLVVVSITLVGASGLTFDEARVRRIVAALEPLSSLPPTQVGWLLYNYCKFIHATIVGPEPECVTLGRQLAAGLLDPKRFRELPQQTRDSWRSGLLLALGTYECYRNDDSARNLAEELEAIGLNMSRMFADQVRMLHHAYRGEMELANRYRDDVERYAVQGGTTWQAEMILPASMILPMLLSGDVVGLKRAAEQLSSLARGAPNLRRYRDIAWANLKFLRGKASEARTELERLVAEMPPRQTTAWHLVRANLGEALIEEGRAEDARRLLESTRSLLTSADRQFTLIAVLVDRIYARALSATGQHAEAARLLDGLIEELAVGTNPLLRGLLHAERARVALSMNDPATFSRNLTEVRRLYRGTRNPALIVQGEQLAQLGVARFDASEACGASNTEPVISAVREAMTQCSTTEERARRALALLAAQTGATAGCFYTVASTELNLEATLNTETPREGIKQELEAGVCEYVASLRLIHDIADDEEMTSTVSRSRSASVRPTNSQVLFFTNERDEGHVLVAVALLWTEDGTAPRLPGPRFTKALAEAFV